ncbi:MAG: O-methyltransferase [Salinivirgaceae bacterium]
MHRIQLVLAYIKFWFTARNRKGFGIHSPFVFKLVTQVIHDYTPFYCYAEIEKERNSLLNNHSFIPVNDLGTGKTKYKWNRRKISKIAKYSLKPARQAQLLFRLVNYFGYRNLLELGTSLGITSSYLAKTDSRTKLITLEGCANTAGLAHETFKKLHINNAELWVGEFGQTLPQALGKLDKLDFVFFDGNHTQSATLEYFERCLKKTHNETLFVFDDIYLNSEMEVAWQTIKKHPQVRVTLNLFHLGLVFFRKELSRQHFKLRF